MNSTHSENLLITHHLPILHLVFPPIYHFYSLTPAKRLGEVSRSMKEALSGSAAVTTRFCFTATLPFPACVCEGVAHCPECLRSRVKTPPSLGCTYCWMRKLHSAEVCTAALMAEDVNLQRLLHRMKERQLLSSWEKPLRQENK